jgi:hypothetical protein
MTNFEEVYSTESKPRTTAEQLLAIAQLAVGHEQKLAQHHNLLQHHNARLTRLEKQLQVIDLDIPEKSVRSSLNELIQDYAYRTGEGFDYLWENLFKEYHRRYNVDLIARAKKSKKRVVDYAEELGVIDKLYGVAVRLYYLED